MTRRITTTAALAALLLVGYALQGAPAEALKTPSLLGYAVQYKTQEGATVYQPVDNQWYAPGNAHLTIPTAGTWRLSYSACLYVSRNRLDSGDWDFGTVGAATTLSTDPAAETDPDLRAFYRVGGANRNAAFTIGSSKVVVVSQPTVYYLLAKQSEGTMDQIQFAAGNANCNPTVIRAERVR
jgi:hypothetical protein